MKTDAQGRRLRFAPPNPGARPQTAPRQIHLQPADYLVFEAIDRHGPLPSNYLFEFQKHLRRDKTTFKKRLTELYNADEQGPFLLRPPQQFAGFKARYQHLVYCLAPRAARALAGRSALNASSPKRNDAFLHQLMQACVGASLELSAGAKGLRYIRREEILTRAKAPLALPIASSLPAGTKLIPDDLFGLYYPDAGYRFFAVEIDRNTEAIERKNLEYNSFGRKVAHYLRVLRGGLFKAWDIPNLSVLVITTNRTHAHNLIEYVRRQDESRYKGRFAFAVAPAFGAMWEVPGTLLAHLFEEPWQTVDGPKTINWP